MDARNLSNSECQPLSLSSVNEKIMSEAVNLELKEILENMDLGYGNQLGSEVSPLYPKSSPLTPTYPPSSFFAKIFRK